MSSGLDITGMVNALVAADRKPVDNNLNLQQSRAKLQISGIATVKSAFDTLNTALTALKAATAFDARTVKSGTEDVLTATGSASAANGSHTIEVESLASAHKLVSNTAIAKDKAFAAGTLTLTVGEGDAQKTLDIEIEEGATLSSIQTRINTAARSQGVQATLITSGDKQYLSLSQEKSGAANTIALSYGGTDADMQALMASMEERSPAADAKLKVDGVEVTAATNTVADIVPGLTLTLKKAGTSTVTIATDTAAARKVMQDFVTAYNGAMTAITTATKYNAETKEAGDLTGDAQMRGAQSQLRGLATNMLADLSAAGLDPATFGLQTKAFPNADGTLVLDTAKFDAALASKPDAIRSVITGENGAAAKLQTLVDGYVSTKTGAKGAFVTRTDGLNATLDDITARRTALDTRMEATAERYKKQFLALESIITSSNSTMATLAQQLANL